MDWDAGWGSALIGVGGVFVSYVLLCFAWAINARLCGDFAWMGLRMVLVHTPLSIPVYEERRWNPFLGGKNSDFTSVGINLM